MGSFKSLVHKILGRKPPVGAGESELVTIPVPMPVLSALRSLKGRMGSHVVAAIRGYSPRHSVGRSWIEILEGSDEPVGLIHARLPRQVLDSLGERPDRHASDAIRFYVAKKLSKKALF